jgi:hypothetical protein
MGWGNKFPDMKNDPTYLEGRLSNAETSLAEIASLLRVNILNPPSGITPAKTDGITDVGPTLQACINYVNTNGGGDIVIPYNANGYALNTAVTLKSNVNIFSEGSVITIPSIANTKFYAINVTNCSNVSFYGQLHFKSTNDKTRPVFTGLSSNVTAIDINTSSDIYIEYVYGENIETIVDVYGTNLANEKNIVVDEIKYYDCNFPFFVKQYSNVRVGYIHGIIQNIALDPHDHVVYVCSSSFDIHFDIVQGNCLNTSISGVWMVQCDTNYYDTAHFGNNITFNSIIVEGNFSGFVCAGFQNVWVGELIGNINCPTGNFIGVYSSSKFQIGNVSLEGSVANFISGLSSTNTTLGECTIHGGKVNASIGVPSGYVIRAQNINQIIVRGVTFNNIAYGGCTLYHVENSTVNLVLFENCTFNYTATLTSYIVQVNSGTLELKGCKFINTQAYWSQVVWNATGTTVKAYNCAISNFGTLLYYNPPAGAIAYSFNGVRLDDNSIQNENGGNAVKSFYGTGNPNNVVTAKVGSLFVRADGTQGNIFYLKQSGSGSSGWNPLQPIDSGTTANRPSYPTAWYQYGDTTLNKPVWCKTIGTLEVDTLTVNSGATASGNITITLNGVGTNVSVSSGDTAGTIGNKIRATTFTGWAVGGTSGSNVVTFTRTQPGTNSAPSFTDTGTTGTSASFAVTTSGTANVWVDSTGAPV